MTLNELFDEQSKTHFLATVEPLSDNDQLVKVTPWVKDAGCMCTYSFNIAREHIDSVEPTGQHHLCCNKVLLVVRVLFNKDATISYNDMFGTLVKNIQQTHKHQDSHKEAEGNVFSNLQANNLTSPINYPCPQGTVPTPCSGTIQCAPPGYFCCGGALCPPGNDCIPCSGTVHCAQRGSTCCGGIICPPGWECRPYSGTVQCFPPKSGSITGI